MTATEPRLPREVEIELLERVFAQHEAHTTSMAEGVVRVPASCYVSQAHHAREQSTVFRTDAVFACLSVDLANVGDRVVINSGGVPIVVVRGSDGAAHAYVNVCRHRAAQLVQAGDEVTRQLACPFHGWVYDLDDGSLRGRPRSCGGFDEVDPSDLGLSPVAVGEQHGLVIVRPQSGGQHDAQSTSGGQHDAQSTSGHPVDVDEWLCGLGAEFADLGYGGVRFYTEGVSTWACNWKLLLDTFLESYHVPTLHRASIAAAYIGAASPFDAFGVHNRIVVPQSAVLAQASAPRAEWQLLPHVVLQYFLAPNVIVSNIPGYVMTWRFIPDAVDRTTVQHRLYTYETVETEERRQHFDARFEAARAVTGIEDFPESERVHANLATGLVDHTLIGRNEPGIVHFHETLVARTGL